MYFVSKVVAFEPSERLFRLLRANAVLNGVEDSMRCHNVALGPERSTANLTMSEGNTGDYRIAGIALPDDSMGEASRTMQGITVMPMDDYLDDFDAGSTLIYMDIQGYEGKALAGASQILATSPPLVVEFWPYGMKRLESYPALRTVVCSGLYGQFANLSEATPQFRTLSAAALDSLYMSLGEGSEKFTDLLLV